MAILIRLLALVIIIGGIYFAIKNAATKEKEDEIDDFKKRNEINQLREKLTEEQNEHHEDVEYLNSQISKLKEELAEAKTTHTID